MSTDEHDKDVPRTPAATPGRQRASLSPQPPPPPGGAAFPLSQPTLAADAVPPDADIPQPPSRPGRDQTQEQPRASRRLRGGSGRADLRAHPFPLLTPEEWRQPHEVLSRMYLDAERRAIEAYDWYMRDRLRKRASSRALRVLAIVLGAAGGLQPLVSAAASGTGLGWGYVLLAGAGVCVAIDHFLGLSSRWMRDMITAQRIHQRLQRFQLDWAALSATEAITTASADTAADGGNADTAHVQEYLDLLRSFAEDISTIMIDETSEWINEFQSGMALLQQSQPGRN
ncbi:SLATT domain-containing protein [Thermopolyspora sp. NPDC052614]|uniref:SLATT domain-containing protein n=1 Tax=Thermopolyspora sp. NPDC052614 TaxID=3155682 RepID=UPI0034207F80